MGALQERITTTTKGSVHLGAGDKVPPDETHRTLRPRPSFRISTPPTVLCCRATRPATPPRESNGGGTRAIPPRACALAADRRTRSTTPWPPPHDMKNSPALQGAAGHHPRFPGEWTNELRKGGKLTVSRARKIEASLSQPFHVRRGVHPAARQKWRLQAPSAASRVLGEGKLRSPDRGAFLT